MTAHHDARLLAADASDLEDAIYSADVRAAMSKVSELAERLPLIAAELVEWGTREGMTQREMARLLGVPERTLRGARREFAS